MPIARDEEIALLFTEARTHYAWLPTPVGDEQLHRLFETFRWAPSASNAQTLRIVFAKSLDAKRRMQPALFPHNVDKAMTAPVTAILAFDPAWWERMPELAPFRPNVREHYAALGAERLDTLGAHNAHIQAGYFILAARALGLDCGPMGGFDHEMLDAAFFAETGWRSQLLVNLGHGDPARTMPRMPRLDFATACRIE
jgi:3-hydroxypropanoate dehydrogenase